MVRPNFFIIGAPKCGTTALSHYLRDHPNVFMSVPKEPHYFATDLPGYREVQTLPAYEQLFSSATPRQRCVGEASVFYLYSREAARRIMDYAPDAKIIIMVRNPVELVTSLHSQLVYSRDEDEHEFRTAWDLRNCRKARQCVPAHCRDQKVLWYDKVARLGEQTERWLDHFPRSQVMIICYDDLLANAGEVYRDVLSFLGVPDDDRTSFPRINARRRQRLSVLATFTERTPHSLVRLAMATKRLLGIEKWGVLERLRRWNTVRVEREELDRLLKREILATYRDDVAHLSHLMARDLDHWLGRWPAAVVD